MRVLTASGGHSYAESVDAGDARPLTPIEHARRIAALAQEKLAADVVILDMRPVCSYTDYFVVCTGPEPASDEGRLRRGPRAAEEGGGAPAACSRRRAARRRWILADYLDVVLHVFTPEAREYYRLEELWGDVPSVELAVAGLASTRFATVRRAGP